MPSSDGDDSGATVGDDAANWPYRATKGVLGFPPPYGVRQSDIATVQRVAIAAARRGTTLIRNQVELLALLTPAEEDDDDGCAIRLPPPSLLQLEEGRAGVEAWVAEGKRAGACSDNPYNARTETVCKYQSCMVSKVRMIWKQRPMVWRVAAAPAAWQRSFARL